jgi:hypothetical protein
VSPIHKTLGKTARRINPLSIVVHPGEDTEETHLSDAAGGLGEVSTEAAITHEHPTIRPHHSHLGGHQLVQSTLQYQMDQAAAMSKKMSRWMLTLNNLLTRCHKRLWLLSLENQWQRKINQLVTQKLLLIKQDGRQCVKRNDKKHERSDRRNDSQ